MQKIELKAKLAVYTKGVLNGGASFEDAPSDGKLYARQNGTWVEVKSIDDVSMDNNYYVRRNGGWVRIEDPSTYLNVPEGHDLVYDGGAVVASEDEEEIHIIYDGGGVNG